MQLLTPQTCQLTQAHINNGLALQFVKIETLFQITLCVSRSLAGTDNVHNFINIIAGNNQSFKDMSTLLSLLQIIFRTTNSHIMTMLHEILHAFFQTQ